MDIEVTIHSMLPNVGGNATVTTNQDATILSLIKTFCSEKGIPFSPDYVIYNKDQQPLQHQTTICDCDMQNGERLIIRLIKPTEGSEMKFCCPGCNQWWALAVVIFIIGLGGVIMVSVLYTTHRPQPEDYAVVLDAGSSHTQVFVYKWPADKENGTGVATQEYTERAQGGGISNYTEDPQLAGKSIEHILDSAVKHVPQNLQLTTPIFLGATAGMRLLEASDNVTSNAILQSVRDTMKTYPFFLNDTHKQVRILDGSEEGTFSWVTVNFLDGNFEKRSLAWHNFLGYIPTYTYGALDLGGASTQITFIPDEEHVLDDYAETVTMYGSNYTAYSHSYLCYGLNEAQRQLFAHLVRNASDNGHVTVITNPCHPAGKTTKLSYGQIFEAPCTSHIAPASISKNTTFTFEGSSDSALCGLATRQIFDFNNADCSDEPCAFNNIHQPSVFGKFYAFSGYYNTLNFLNSTSATLPEYINAMDEFCAKNWTEVSVLPDRPVYLLMYCFDAHFIHSILIDGYKFNNDTWSSILFQKSINGADLGWTLGFTLNVTNRFPVRYSENFITVTTFVLLLLFFIIFVGIAFGFGCHAYQRKKYQTGEYHEIPSRQNSYGAI